MPEIHLKNIYIFSTYLTVNTLHIHYKDKYVNTRCLFCELFITEN